MDGLQLIRGQHLHGWVGIFDFEPRQLRNAASVEASAAASLTPPNWIHDHLLAGRKPAALRRNPTRLPVPPAHGGATVQTAPPIAPSPEDRKDIGLRPRRKSPSALRPGRAAGCRRARPAADRA